MLSASQCIFFFLSKTVKKCRKVTLVSGTCRKVTISAGNYRFSPESIFAGNCLPETNEKLNNKSNSDAAPPNPRCSKGFIRYDYFFAFLFFLFFFMALLPAGALFLSFCRRAGCQLLRPLVHASLLSHTDVPSSYVKAACLCL